MQYGQQISELARVAIDIFTIRGIACYAKRRILLCILLAKLLGSYFYHALIIKKINVANIHFVIRDSPQRLLYKKKNK